MQFYGDVPSSPGRNSKSGRYCSSGGFAPQVGSSRSELKIPKAVIGYAQSEVEEGREGDIRCRPNQRWQFAKKLTFGLQQPQPDLLFLCPRTKSATRTSCMFKQEGEENAMKSKQTIDPDMCMDDLMRQWPETIGVLIRNRMLCVGCPIALFHTVAEACEEHDVNEETFVRELVAVIPA
jgi:hybrid cluster-associated redox disulfide protein